MSHRETIKVQVKINNKNNNKIPDTILQYFITRIYLSCTFKTRNGMNNLVGSRDLRFKFI